MRGVNWRIIVAGLLCSVPASVFAQSDDATAEDLGPSELADFRATRIRFENRMDEWSKDTVGYVDLREQDAREKVREGYDLLIRSLEGQEAERRANAINQFETFLAQYSNAEYASHVRFRLAELYFEEASEQWLTASTEYFEKLEGDLSIEELESIGEEPRVDLSKSVNLYWEIVEHNRGLSLEQRYERLDAVYLMLGFCFMDSNSAQKNAQGARDVFGELIEVFPDSDLSDRAHLFLGNFFNFFHL